MGLIYTGIDIGTDSVKIVVTEKVDGKFHVLASVSEKSLGIKNGQVEDTKKSVNSVKKAIHRINEMLGIKITKVVTCVAPTLCTMDIVVGHCDILGNAVTYDDINHVLKDAICGKIDSEHELITAMPIHFKIDDQDALFDPKGIKGNVLETKVVISVVPKEPLYRIFEVLKLSGLETVDVAYTSTGDYFAIKNKKIDQVVGAIINIGETSTNVSIFNKGIQIKNAILPIGSRNVDKDISYIFKINLEDARKVKENFSVAFSSYADCNDLYDVLNLSKEKIEISQPGVSKVVEARIREILNLAKNEIKTLTNREIRYIIITGGLSEISGFQYLIEDEFGVFAKVCNLSTVGVRHNKYSSVLGMVKYFDDKLSLRGKSYQMVSDEDIQSLVSVQQKVINSDHIIGKLFGHFFDN